MIKRKPAGEPKKDEPALENVPTGPEETPSNSLHPTEAQETLEPNATATESQGPNPGDMNKLPSSETLTTTQTPTEEPSAPATPASLAGCELDGLPEKGFFEGGCSQWREDAEEMWSEWNWPPGGWRPQYWQDAYHNNKSKWYRYNAFDWDSYYAGWNSNKGQSGSEGAHTPQSSTPTETPQSNTRCMSSDLESIAHQLQRANTGDQLSFQQKLDAADGNCSQSPPTDGKQPNVNPAPTQQAKTQENAQEHGPEQGLPEQEQDKKLKKLEADKLQAHARYMRYYRNIRSPELRSASNFCSHINPNSPYLLCHLDPNTLIELRKMAQEAKGSNLASFVTNPTNYESVCT